MARTLHLNRTFCAAHRIWNDSSPCRNIHGHNYRVDVSIVVPDDYPLTDEGFVVAWDDVKQAIDAYDHVLLLHADDPLVEELAAGETNYATLPSMPSTENLARELCEDIAQLVRRSAMVHVRLRETDSIEASWAAAGVIR